MAAPNMRYDLEGSWGVGTGIVFTGTASSVLIDTVWIASSIFPCLLKNVFLVESDPKLMYCV